MTIFGDDHAARLGRTHEIGQDLSALSIAEIDLRIAALHEEIARLVQERVRKDASRIAAETIFRKSD